MALDMFKYSGYDRILPIRIGEILKLCDSYYLVHYIRRQVKKYTYSLGAGQSTTDNLTDIAGSLNKHFMHYLSIAISKSGAGTEQVGIKMGGADIFSSVESDYLDSTKAPDSSPFYLDMYSFSQTDYLVLTPKEAGGSASVTITVYILMEELGIKNLGPLVGQEPDTYKIVNLWGTSCPVSREYDSTYDIIGKLY